MNDDRTMHVLRKIQDRVPRDQLNGNSLRALYRRGLIRRVYMKGKNGMAIRYYRLTKSGFAALRGYQ